MEFCKYCNLETDSSCEYCEEEYCSDCERSEHKFCKYNYPLDYEGTYPECEDLEYANY